MRNEFKKESLAIGLFGVAIVMGTILSGCGSYTTMRGPKGDTGATGPIGASGNQGYGAGILSDYIPGLCGATDGVRFTVFQDKNNDTLLDADETVTSVSTVCNGSSGLNGQNGHNGNNGQNGISTTTTFALLSPGATCPTGGYTLSVQNGPMTSSFPICNGLNGVDGAQGIQGLQGVAGSNGNNGHDGTNGTVVTPVKFCNSDTSTYPEYGLYIGSDLFAVYWGSTPASSAAQAFLTKLVPGSYMSTGGNNCQFTIH